MATVGDIRFLAEETAQPAFAYEWDHVGLQAGDPKQTVTRVLLALDVTRAVIEEAKAQNCGMILSHHPLLFRPITSASLECAEGEMLSLLYRYSIALYCAHTSLDAAPGGVNDALCDLLELSDITLLSPYEAGDTTVACGRMGTLPYLMNGEELLDFVKKKTGAHTLLHGGLAGHVFRTLALSTGAAGEEGLHSPADVFLTGEMKYHTALEMRRIGKAFLAAGHFQTENPVCAFWAKHLQKRADMLQYNVTFLVSQVNTDPFDT
ncbi:MAG: Nif3-like dinuclear metal center hexameric protein [Clostridia bacterium]|nr:Nif3-like dinuclear metal center hexameric protein [Clostridia bacterium]